MRVEGLRLLAAGFLGLAAGALVCLIRLIQLISLGQQGPFFFAGAP
jgi:hypothetical protein